MFLARFCEDDSCSNWILSTTNVFVAIKPGISPINVHWTHHSWKQTRRNKQSIMTKIGQSLESFWRCLSFSGFSCGLWKNSKQTCNRLRLHSRSRTRRHPGNDQDDTANSHHKMVCRLNKVDNMVVHHPMRIDNQNIWLIVRFPNHFPPFFLSLFDLVLSRGFKPVLTCCNCLKKPVYKFQARTKKMAKMGR